MTTRIYYHPKTNQIVLVEESGIAPIKYLKKEKNREESGLFSIYLMERDGYVLVGVDEDVESAPYRL